MALEPDVQSVEHKDNADDEDGAAIGASGTVLEATEDESEDEDVDFNPFMKEIPSEEEASSSLSSEVEGVDADVVNSCSGDAMLAPQGVGALVECRIGSPMEDEKADVLCEGEQENGRVREKESGSSSGNDVVEDAFAERISMTDLNSKPLIDFDDEDDAICKRTRARYSLACFTLDELETFLQETDDEDDVQNVDEEEEYRKFLTAVLKGADGHDQGNAEGNDDDDEDNDADFEIEIEEALESDVDDCIIMSNNDEEFEKSSRRPKTRQNRRNRGNVPNKNKVMEQGHRPLRPLVPVIPSAPMASVPCLGPRYLTNPSCAPDSLLNGFVPHQIGQLYCLIYEHVQLLIQAYSLCVLEPSRQHIASQTKGLLAELLHKRDLVLAWRNAPYPISYFRPPYVHSSVSFETQKHLPAEDSGVSFDGDHGQGCRWLPPVSGPVLSLLDVEPLKLVGNFFNDVSNAVREHQRHCVETTNIYLDKQPLFPLPVCPPPEVNGSVSRGDYQTPNATAVSSNEKVPKKTLAATLVESTKKQSLALVPQQIAKIAQPFYSLFNPALFPHKAPSPSVANRVLFTDAEDVLLAMGMMEYNNDWKAIQQRFLPCKSEHQIFVRAKNRSSSKAPDNPIKTVRKLKTSPLTEEEKSRIQEGLKAFKLDWTSVWRAVVPYRDPNLLPRQWRIAIGTQKSYKVDSVKKEKHRLYESKRRSKVAAMGNSQNGSEKEDNHTVFAAGQNDNRLDGVDNGNEAYVHEAFLADWRPTSSGTIASRLPSSSPQARCLPGDAAASRCCELEEASVDHGNQESLSKKDCANEVPTASEDSHLMNNRFRQGYISSGYLPSVSTSKTFAYESLMNTQRVQRPNIPNLVKLAPELPPVKLPPAVRILSQASLRGSQPGSSTEVSAAGPGFGNAVSDPTTIDYASNPVDTVQDSTKVSIPNSACVSSQNCGPLKKRDPTKERGTDLDPQMHPLLFRNLEVGHLPCYPVTSSSGIPTFSFFPAMQHQMNVNLLRYPCPAFLSTGLTSFRSKEIASSSSCLDFHPLLQRTNDHKSNPIGPNPTGASLTTDLGLSRDQYVEEIVYHAGATAAQLASATRPTSPISDANDLDLDIHLSSASRKRKFSSHEGAKINDIVPSVRVLKSVEGAKDGSDAHGQVLQLAGRLPTDSVAAGHKEKSSYDGSAVQLHNLEGNSGACTQNNVSDQPLVEIVMEQEELSDSEEEMEDVEFECEEITDSDGEDGSVAEQIVNTQYKDEADTTLGTVAHVQQSESVTCGASIGIQGQIKGRTPRPGSVRLGKGSTKGSWLSLSSRGSHHTPQLGAKPTESSAGVPALMRSSRYSKKAMLRAKTSTPGEQSADLPRPDPLPLSSRKSRKQTLKFPSASGTDIAVGNSSCIENDS